MVSYIQLCPKEKKVISLLETIISKKALKIKLLSKTELEEGDILIGDDSKAHPHFCLERKTLADLKNSVTGITKRYEKQNARMHSLRERGTVKGIGYIIESKSQNEKDLGIDSILYSLRYKHLMIVNIVPDISATCEFIIGLATRVMEYVKFTAIPTEKLDQIGVPIKINQKEIKSSTIFVRQLALIVPLNTAMLISSVYPDMKSLMSAWHACKDTGSAEKLLVGMKDPNMTKAIGSKTSINVYNAFYFSTQFANTTNTTNGN